MLRINRLVIISLLIFTQIALWGQNNTNSPYTRFGYGGLADRAMGSGKAMGGIGIGLRSKKQINPMNPASYSCMDSMTFIFDFGASGQVSWFKEGDNYERKLNGNIESLAMQFPLAKGLAMSVGLLPYSFVGYEFGEIAQQDGLVWTEAFAGKGGINDLYAGLSYEVWKKRLAIGVNAGFLFGSITHSRALAFSESTGGDDVTRNEKYRVRDVKLDIGVQYVHPLSATDQLVFGVVYSPRNSLNMTVYEEQVVGSASDYTQRDTITGSKFGMPDSYGFGVSFVRNNKLTLAADVLYETWSKCYFNNEKGQFENRIRVALGGEYIPDSRSRNYFSNVSYRAGLHYSNSYLKVNRSAQNSYEGYGYNEIGASIGFGFPMIDNRSLVNVTFEYVKVRPESRAMIDEQYFRFSLNYTFNELWFFKRKVD